MTKTIRTEADCQAGVERVESLIDAKPGTAESDELDILASAIQRYENKHFPIGAPTALAATRFRMDQSE